MRSHDQYGKTLELPQQTQKLQYPNAKLRLEVFRAERCESPVELIERWTLVRDATNLHMHLRRFEEKLSGPDRRYAEII